MSSNSSNSSNSNSDPLVSDDSSDDGEYQRLLQEAIDATFKVEELAVQRIRNAQPGSSQRRRRRRYINREWEQGYERVYKDYFSNEPTYPDHIFRRRFRMRKQVFLRIVERLENGMEFFQQRPDAMGRLGISALQKCTGALRMLAYGSVADAVDEYVRLSAATARLCLEQFVDGIIAFFGPEYLRRPTVEDTQRLLSVGESRGFPGMLGSIDCMHWGWKNCPTSWKGQYARGHGHSTIILEVVVSYDLWFWHAFFGVAGSSNDINVLDQSPVFDEVLAGRSPNVHFTVNDNEYNMGYYLTDGIYPQWASFVQSIRLPQGPQAQLFANHQEAVRKDVERGFGVLQSRFAIIRNPALSWDLVKIGKIMRACIIMHNMIVEDERDSYSHHGYTIPEHDEEISGGNASVNDPDFTYSSNRPTSMTNYLSSKTEQLQSSYTHLRLKEDLKNHIWQLYGDN